MVVVPNSHLDLHPHKILGTGSPNYFKRSSVGMRIQVRIWPKCAGTGFQLLRTVYFKDQNEIPSTF
jgi:hypothetical protein